MSTLAVNGTDGFSYGMELAQKLSRLMEQKRLSQADVARAAGMQQTAISGLQAPGKLVTDRCH